MKLSTKKIADLLDDTKWGSEFPREDVERIAKYLSVHTYKKGEFIFRQGERQNYMAFIVQGRVDIRKESVDTLEKILVTLSSRTCFGEMSFIDDEPRSASAVARDDVVLLVLSSDNFERILADHPYIGIKILKSIAKMISQRLRMTTGKLVYTRP